jgi:hypothetical protein
MMQTNNSTAKIDESAQPKKCFSYTMHITVLEMKWTKGTQNTPEHDPEIGCDMYPAGQTGGVNSAKK